MVMRCGYEITRQNIIIRYGHEIQCQNIIVRYGEKGIVMTCDYDIRVEI
jgi:hypothetical protein